MHKSIISTAGALVSVFLISAPVAAQEAVARGNLEAMNNVDVAGLIGKDVVDAKRESIGEIESVHVNTDGEVESVIVGVGGFLNMGEHDVAIDWDILNFSKDGEEISVALTETQLKAMPPYEYKNPSYRGTVFTDPS